MNGKKDLLNDDEFFDREISEFLATYTVETVDEDKVDETIDVLRAYMPKAKNKYQLFKLMKNEITYVNKMYWVISMIVIILGIMVTNQQNYSAYETLLYISPIPIILGIYEIERSKRENMWELEKSFKYSYSKVMLAKMIIIMAFTTIINMLLSLFIYSGQSTSELIRIMTAWIVPICIVFSINIIILNKVSSNYSIIITSVLWIITLVLGRKWIINFIEGAEIILLIITMAISISIFLFAALQFYNNSKKYEGELSWS